MANFMAYMFCLFLLTFIYCVMGCACVEHVCHSAHAEVGPPLAGVSSLLPPGSGVKFTLPTEPTSQLYHNFLILQGGTSR